MSRTPVEVELGFPKRAGTPIELGPQYESDDDDSLHETTPLRGYALSNRSDSLPYSSIETGGKIQDNWTTFKTRAKYYIPVFSWLPSYSLKYFWNDFIAGLTVTAILLPSGLSYSVLAKVPPVHGLYTIVISGIVYSFLGTSRQLSIGPEAMVAMLVGSSVASQQKYIPHDDDTDQAETAVMLASLVTMFVGILTLLLGLIRLGFLDSILSRPLLRGFITAVAFVIIVEQFIPMLGLAKMAEHHKITHATSTYDKCLFIIENLEGIHRLTALVSLGSLTFLLTFRLIKSKLSSRYPPAQFVPEILICVVIFTIMCKYFDWESENLVILGGIKGSGLPKFAIPKMPTVPQFKDCFETAVLISIVGFVESIVVTKTYATKHNYAVSPNRELVALGAANLVGSFFQCIVAYGGMARSRINDRAGAKTQFSGLVTALFVLFCLFFLLPCFYYLPHAVLGSIVCVAALSLLSETPHDLRFMYKIKAWNDLALLMLCFFVTIFVSIEYGTLISIALSLVLVVKHSTYPRITILGRVGSSNRFKRIKDFPEQAVHIKGVLVVKIEEPLYFANTGQLKDRLRRLEEFGDMNVHPSEEARMSPVKNVIFDIETMENLDASAALILVEIVEAYQKRDVDVYFVKLHENQRKVFERANLIERVERDGKKHFFWRIAEALEYISINSNDENANNNNGNTNFISME
ncbi:1531_t:CDS:2 [Ambispora leptoticha]|uniref:1531_t:CDS:1 n=1 Tax=Ambispora leptoticha TaxID=144679 RepID=A0A9N9FRF7_9GLOM|nr:1531_t:CDS:2 [Ambispora leptoticha]